jgi:Ca2+-binding RTX toxin-like protein
VPIIDDTDVEDDETMNLALSNADGGATLGIPNTAMVTIVDNEGPPPVMCAGDAVTIAGTPNDDELRGTAGPDVIRSFSGNDVIFGLDGDDLICGGLGNDSVNGSLGHDRLLGEGGYDRLVDLAGNDQLQRRLS